MDQSDALGVACAESGMLPGPMLDFLCVCVRVPKSGSASLKRIVRAGFEGHRIFYLPNTLDPDAKFSALQRYRGRRSRMQNLFRHYRSVRVAVAYEAITRQAMNGDLIDGGHIDFQAAVTNIPRKLKMVTLLRDPAARILSEYNYSRQGYFKKPFFNRFDAGILHKAAARYSFAGYLDFLLEHRELYGDIASLYLGWNGAEDLRAYFDRNVFHAGTLEAREHFAVGLSEKLGRSLRFPHENRTQAWTTVQATSSERAKIVRLYDRDFTLYEWVRDNL